MQKCGTTKIVLYKEFTKSLSSSHTLSIQSLMKHRCIHMHLHITTYGQTNNHGLETSTGRECPGFNATLNAIWTSFKLPSQRSASKTAVP